MPKGRFPSCMLSALGAVVAVGFLDVVQAAFGGTCTPPVGGIFRISTDDDLDFIRADCNVVEGSVDVSCDTIADPTCICNVTSLDAFHLVERITGYLRIEGCHSLTTLGGLERLKVIEGRTALYDEADTAYGFSIWIEGNNALTSLAGLQNLTAAGKGGDPPGRVFIGGNNNLCGGELIDWNPIVSEQRRVVYDEAGAVALSGRCSFYSCSSSCGCHTKCFGPGGGNCQGFCGDTSDTEVFTIVSVVLVTLIVGVVSFFVVLCRTNRLGCRMSCHRRHFRYGNVPDSGRNVRPPRSTPIDDAWASAVDLKSDLRRQSTEQTEHAQKADPAPFSADESMYKETAM